MPDGVTEERLSIVSAIRGDKQVTGSLTQMAAAADEAAKDREATITYHDKGTLTSISRKVKGFERTLHTVNGALRSGIMGVRGAFMSLVGIPAIFSAIAIAIGGLPGLVSALTGAVVALGVGITAVVASLSVFLIGLSGIPSAVSEASTATEQAKAEAERYEAALRTVAAATREVSAANKDAADAQKVLKTAEDRFRDAPEDAARALADARLRSAEATLSEKEAVLQLQRAQKNLSELQKNVGKSTLTIAQQTDAFTGKIVESVTKSAAAIGSDDILSAQYAVEQAELALIRAKREGVEAQDDLSEMTAKGIEGSDIYTSALDDLRNAQDRVTQSQVRMEQAQYDLARAQKDAVPQTTAFQKAMEKLTPQGRTFVTFVNGSLIPSFRLIRDEVQARLLPGVQTGLQVLVDNTGGLSDAFGRLGQATGDSFARFMQYWGKPENKGVLSTLVDGLAGPDGAISQLERAITPLSSVLAQVITAATPLFNTLMHEFGTWLEGIDASLKAGGAGELESWFSHLAGPITNTFGLLGDFANALAPLTTENGFFNQLITDLRQQFIPAFRELVTAISDSNLAQGMVSVLTAVTGFLTWLVQANNASGNLILYSILALFASSAFLNGVMGFTGLVTALTGLNAGGAVAGAAGAGSAAAGAGGAAATAGGIGLGAGGAIVGGILASIVATGQTLSTANTAVANNDFRAGSALIPMLIQPWTAMVQTALDAFFPELGKEFRSFLEDWGTNAYNWWSGFSSDVQTGWNNTVSFLSGVVAGFERGVNNTLAFLTGVGDGFAKSWQSAQTELGNFWRDAGLFWEGVGREWDNFWRDFGTGWDNAWKGVRNGFAGIINGIIDGYNAIPILPDIPIRLAMAADGATVPGGGSYRDKRPYLLAPGEEVISNRYGQADRHRGLLKAINSGSYDGNPGAVDIEALVGRILDAVKPNVSMEVKVEDGASADEIAEELAWRLR